MTFHQGRVSYNRIPRRRLADQPKLAKIRELGKHVDHMFDRFVDADAWKGLKEKIFGKEFQLGVKEVTQQAIIGVTGLVGGTGGKVFGLGMEIGSIARSLTGYDNKWGRSNPNVGDWVAISNGVETVKKNVKAALGLGGASMFMDSATKADEAIEIGNTVSIGFYLHEGTAPGLKTVFNFQTSGQQERHLNELMVLDKERQDTLNGNHILARLKSIVLGKDTLPARNAEAVPVDEGSEVVYDGAVYTIVECDGFSAKITNKVKTLNVDVSELSRGRVEHTNSWNYAENTDGGFSADSKAEFHKGQWVWLRPRYSTKMVYAKAKYELGILRIINGAIADGFYAMDGVRFQTVLSQVRPCPKHGQEWMGLQKEFLRFKIAAVKGIDVPRYKLGRDWALQVLGVKTVGDSEPKQTPAGPVEKNPEVSRLAKMKKILDVGLRNEQEWPIRPEDKADSAKEKLAVAKDIQDSLKITQGRANEIVNASENPEHVVYPGNTAPSTYVFGVVIFCAAIYLISYT